jgi:hypothetical protein
LPDGSPIPTRLTAVVRQEHGSEWKLVHADRKVGVPDEEAAG